MSFLLLQDETYSGSSLLGGGLLLGLGLSLLGGSGSRLGLLLCELHGSRGTWVVLVGLENVVAANASMWCEHTLRAREFTLLLTRGNGAVDMALEGGVGDVVELVVSLDVLLDSLTAVRSKSVRALKSLRPKHDATSTMNICGGRLTLIHCVP